MVPFRTSLIKEATGPRVPFGTFKSPLRTFYGRNYDLGDSYGISVSQMTTDMFHLSQTLPGPLFIHDLLPGL